MKIKELYIYPIKSLRGISLPSSELSLTGLQYDRRFMLLKEGSDGKQQNMLISKFSEMSLFQTAIDMNTPTSEMKEIGVTYLTPKKPVAPFHSDQTRSIKIPLTPDSRPLEKIEVNLHLSPTFAYKMPHEINSWFSNCFGYPVVLAYLGDGLRRPLGSISPNWRPEVPRPAKSRSSWLPSLSAFLPLPGHFQGVAQEDNITDEDAITFADCAQVLVVCESSLADVHPRFNEADGDEKFESQEPVKMDVRKFRPNIIVDGDPEAPWDEDFWGELTVLPLNSPSLTNGDIDQENGHDDENETDSSLKITLTANCGRCASINVDYETGNPGTGPDGSALKKLMKDRRVDKGVKYSPIFGRYGFLSSTGKEGVGSLSVGDEVVVSRRNEEHTVFHWPGLTN